MRQPHDPSPEFDQSPDHLLAGQGTWDKAAPNYHRVQIIRSSKPSLQGMSPRLIQLFEQNRVAKDRSWNPLKKFGVFSASRKFNSNSYLIARKYSGETIRLITATLLLVGYILALGLSVAVITTIFTAMLPALATYRLAISLLLVFLLAMLNLEGSRLASFRLPETAYFGLIGLLALGSFLLGYDSVFAGMLQGLIALAMIVTAAIAFARFSGLINLLVFDRFLPQIFSSTTNPRNGYSSALLLGLFASLSLVVTNGQIANLLPPYLAAIAGAVTLSQLAIIIRGPQEMRNGPPSISHFQLLNKIILAFLSLSLLGLVLFFFLPQVWPVLIIILLWGLVLKISERYYSQEYEPLPVLKVEKPVRSGGSAGDKDWAKYAVIVPVNRLDKLSLATINFARTLGESVTAILMSDGLAELEDIYDNWDKSLKGVRLVVLESSFSSPLPALLNYLEKVECNELGKKLKLVLPQVETRHWWEQLLHDQGFNFVKEILVSRKGTEVITVAFRPKRATKFKS